MLTIGKNNFDEWELLLRVLSEEIPENDPVFEAWLLENEENRETYRSLKGGIPVDGLVFDKDKMYTNIADKLSLNRKKAPLYRRTGFGYAAAVCVFFISALVTYLILDNKEPPVQIAGELEIKDRFEPGSKKAYLLPSQGDAIDLSEAFEVVKEDGTVISNDAQGVVSIEKKEDEKVKPVEDHTIYVPRGGEYTLVLADGSKVYLNSETRLTFPSYFDNNQRKVTLTGEAYFEIKKDNTPFIVQTNDMQIKVLGTSFNVNAYQENLFANTTLVEGSVEVYANDVPEPLSLKPGENLNLDKSSHKISVNPVNTNEYTAWIKGEFTFRNQPLSEIFSQLRRWYDFEILYEDQAIQTMRFTGSAEKGRPLEYLLNLIQSVTDVKYKSKEDKIILY